MTSHNLVEIHEVGKTFNTNLPPALENINANLPKGQIIGIAGPDGSGKTTLIRLMAGLLLPTKGQITVDGYDSIKDAECIHEIIGYMPQKFGLYEDLTVIQNLNLYADLRGVLGADRKEAFQKLLKFTGLEPFVTRLAGNLSGGMKQKLGLACTLVKTPTLLLLDEPSVGVDPISRRELWRMVNDLLKEGISVVWSTAYLDEAERCDTVILLNEGKMLYNGVPKALTERVKDRVFKVSNITENKRVILSRALLEPNIIDGIIQGSEIRLVSKKKGNPPFNVLALSVGDPLKIMPTPPRFEDAFIDILGGGPGGKSELADKTPFVDNQQGIMIEANGLTKKFGNFTAADHISFEVNKGEIFGLLGPNGAGKSTTFKMMCGLLTPTSGKATINGLDFRTAPGAGRSQIGYMAQKFSLYGNLSVLENLEFFSGIYNLSGRARREAVDEMVEIFKFDQYLNESSEGIPLGFKQRLALSCAVMHRPKVLFLDEPTSGVDPIVRREFWNHINGLVEKGVTVVVTTHFMDEAEYCDRIGLIYRSKLIRSGTPDSLKLEAKSNNNPEPTLEDAFIKLIEGYDVEQPE
jgi:ABC-2 type transport system ATP-binding protein